MKLLSEKQYTVIVYFQRFQNFDLGSPIVKKQT